MEHFDVLIVGAGLSGIGAGVHLKTECPGKTFAILEGRDTMGGTWDLFRYPGVRSDSDMFTLGYRFKPWLDGKAIADGPSILNYIRETASDFGLNEHIRYNSRVNRASWSSSDSLWTVETGTGEPMTCRLIYFSTGYYDYAGGYTPDWDGLDEFGGAVVHPQHWPDALDYRGKRVVVVGSGATAVTIVPAMAETADHVTMLQRSPTYVVSMPSQDRAADRLRALLPKGAAYAAARWKNIVRQMCFYKLSRSYPSLMKRLIAAGIRRELGDEIAGEHFSPGYNPWDQRLCLVPDGDLFAAIRDGRASVVTAEIERFTQTGVMLTTGEKLDADIVVTATGLVLRLMAGLTLVVDGDVVDLSEKIAYRGMMYNDVPNAASAFGYTNASWTLKCDLTAQYVCRLLKYMDDNGYASCTPRLNDPTVEREPVLDFTSGYVQRALATLPSQGSKPPWRLPQNYLRDLSMLRFGRVNDGTMEFRAYGELTKP